MEVTREDFAEFVSLLDEDDEDDRAMLQALRSMQEAYADPKVREAVDALEQERAKDQAMLTLARSEGKAARLRETNTKPEALAEEYAKLVMTAWEEENPSNYPEPPWDKFARDKEISDVKQWTREHDDRVAARYFRASGLYHGMIESFLEGFNELCE